MNSYIETLTWRYATKKFDPSKKVSQADMEVLKKSIQLSASSYGLQPFEVYIIDNTDLREKLRPVSWGQPQVTDASHVFVFCNKKQIEEQFIDNFVENTGKTRNIPLENLKGYADFMKTKILSLSPQEQQNWTARQAYIAVGNLLSAAAHLHIDSCPMEGFEPEKFNELLDLDAKGLNACVMVTVGYRSSEDQTQFNAKVRRSEEDLFTTL